MLDELINPVLIEQTLKNKEASPLELELTYRLRDALDEIENLCKEVCVLEAQSIVQRSGYADVENT